MTNIQIDIVENGTTTLATAGCFCEQDIDINTAVPVTGTDAWRNFYFSVINKTVTRVTKEHLEGVAAIPASFFSYCNLLTSIEFAEGLKTINSDAFMATPVISFHFPASLTSVGDAYRNCKHIEAITVEANNSIYYSQDNCLIKRSSNALVLGCKTSIIPNSVTKIESNAFMGREGFTQIAIPNQVVAIDSQAFMNCSSLTTIFFPKSLTTIGSMAFFSSSITDIYYEGTEEEWAQVSIGSSNTPITSATKHYNFMGLPS